MIRKILLKSEARWLNFKNRIFIKYFNFVPIITPYISYGTINTLTVQLRCILHSEKRYHSVISRGFHAFFSKQVPNAKIEVMLDEFDEPLHFTTDVGGYVLKTINCNLTPGNKEITFKFLDDYTVSHKNPKKSVTAKVLGDNFTVNARAIIIDPADSVGIICDIDDTIIQSNAPSKLIAVKNLLFASPQHRKPIPGMVELLNFLRDSVPNSFIIYLSAGSWNQHFFLKRFIAVHRFPFGPIILQDIGPDDTKVFESTRGHKFSQIDNIFNQYNVSKWILVGDDGQYDAQIYKTVSKKYPGRVLCVLIRQLTSFRDLILPKTLFNTPDKSTSLSRILSIIYAPNGFELIEQVKQKLPHLDSNQGHTD